MNSKIGLKVVSGITLLTMVGYTLPVFAYEKDETVYSKLDVKGNNYKTIVSTHIKNSNEEELLTDMTDLLNVKNTNGDETFVQDGTKFTWNANKNDIYYQGETEKELPIECEVKYELNGEEISAEEIAGKDGNVKVILHYTNKEGRYVNINGKTVKMYVPFVVVAGTIVKNDNNKNITVSNGKVVDDGTKSIVVGMAMPGLQESLGVSKSEIDIPGDIEITMEAKHFEMGTIASYVTPKVLEENDTKVFRKLDDLYFKIDTLQDSSNQIVDGANKLNTGIQTLNSSVSELNDGANKIANGTSELADGQSKITAGLNKINSGLKTNQELDENKQQLSTLSQGNKLAKQKLTAQVTTATASVTELQTQLGVVNTNLAAIKTGLASGGIVVSETMTEEQFAATIDGINAQITTLNGQITTLTAGITASNDVATIKTYATNLKSAEEGKNSYQKAIDNINLYKSLLGTKKLITANIESLTGLGATINGTEENPGLITLIDSNEQVVQSSLGTVSSMKDLNSGVSQLLAGSKSAQKGASDLANGSAALAEGTGKLVAGTTQLADGSNTLSEGITKFNEEGIEKICDYINGNAKNLSTRIEKLTELSKEYNNFTMLENGNEGNVKFIMIIDALKEKTDSEQNKEDAVLNTNTLIDSKEE